MSDCISRQAVIDAVGKAMPQLTTPDGCGEFDHEIQIAAEAFSDCMKIINDLPSAQPDVPDTNVGDIISRQAAIDAIDVKNVNKGIISALQSIIEDLPSAQPFTAEQIQTMQELESAQIEKAYELGQADRPTGHWIKNEGMAPPEFTGRYVCSICGDYALMSMPYGSKQELSNFCPNCGKRMESEK